MGAAGVGTGAASHVLSGKECALISYSPYQDQIAPTVGKQGKSTIVVFYPTTCNGFNPGYHCRRMLGTST